MAEPLVLLFLGRRWHETVPLIQVLAIDGVLTVFLSTAYHLNLAVGMSRSTSLVLACHAAITIAVMLWTVPTHGSFGAALAMLAGSIATAPLNFVLLRRAVRFGTREIAELVRRPMVSSLVMTIVVLSIKAHWEIPATITGLVGFIAAVSGTGALVYAFCAFLLSRWQGNPDSAEAWIWQQGTFVLHRCLTRTSLLYRQAP